MQFVENGPDVPDRLIEAHEDGRVVFFCGAGISYPAGLPTFEGLVKKVYESLGEDPNDIEQSALDGRLYDTTLGLLERRIVGGRAALRSKLAEALEPDFSRPTATTMHEALLTLARSRDRNGSSEGKLRLITTNFDRIFEYLRGQKFSDCPVFSAPLLPIPKQRWDGLVYLHGLLPERIDERDLDRLVVTSGDFGLAYLSERWAARFVSELFRTFSICFVGYSLNDPILRYMRDALAADAQLGESPIEAFAFVGVRKGSEEKDKREWLAKNVTPILYPSAPNHVLLQSTLKEWAGVYRDGISGKERIVAELGPYLPTMSTVQDDPVGRLIWALVDRSGVPARKFAELEPVPPIEWLAPLAERRFGHAELTRFGIMPNRDIDCKLSFSVLARPSPYGLAPSMRLVGNKDDASSFDDVMNQLGRWLARHLDKAALLLWVAKEGGRIHQFWRGYIEAQLSKGSLPTPYRVIWSLILADRVMGANRGISILGWIGRWRKDGFTASLRFELRTLLAPMVQLDERWSASSEAGEAQPSSVSEVLSGKVVLATQHPRSLLAEVRKEGPWLEALAEMLRDFVQLLNDALELKRQLDDGVYSQWSYLDLPSVEEHSQNTYRRDWILLVDLCRDAWLSLAKKDPIAAGKEAQEWILSPHAIFRRLALFAAAQEGVVETGQALGWLISGDNLWSLNTRREAIRLIVALGPRLTKEDSASLQSALLSGAERTPKKRRERDAQFRRIMDQEVWLRLSKLKEAGAVLTEEALARIGRYEKAYPNWKLDDGDRDEFASWVGEVPVLRAPASPKTAKELAKWLLEHPDSGKYEERDDWAERCRIDFPRAACALLSLANANRWLPDRWREALQAWVDERLVRRSWRWMGRVLANAENDLLQRLGVSLSSWLQAVGKYAQGQDELFFGLIVRVLSIYKESREHSRNDYVSQAINHPVGHVTEAALTRWYQRAPKDAELLPFDLQKVMAEVANVDVEAFRHGRVLMAAHVISLYRVDPTWTNAHFLPRFDWSSDCQEALAVWQGFLWIPRFYIPLVAAIREGFLATAERFVDLADFGQGYASMLALAGLEPRDLFSKRDIRVAVRNLPLPGLEALASAVVDFQKAAGDAQSEYWVNRTAQFLKNAWPKSLVPHSADIGVSFARIAVASGSSFPDAFAELRYWMQRSDYVGMALVELKESGHCVHYPDAALKLLDALVGDGWPPSDLDYCLDAIREAKPELTSLAAYKRLRGVLRAFGKC